MLMLIRLMQFYTQQLAVIVKFTIINCCDVLPLKDCDKNYCRQNDVTVIHIQT